MSIKVMTEVWEHAPCMGTELLVLLALADSANDERGCWPGLRSIAKKGRIQLRQCINIVQDLELQGFVEIEHRKDERRNNLSNHYYIRKVEDWLLLWAYEVNNPSASCNTTLVHRATLGVLHSEGESVIEPSYEPKLKRGSKKTATKTAPKQVPELHPLIAQWATIRKIDAVNIGAPIFTPKDLATAKRMAKWDTPPTEDEIKSAIGASTVKAYPFMWLEQDIPKQRLAKAAASQPTPLSTSTPTDAQLAHDYQEMFGDKH